MDLKLLPNNSMTFGDNQHGNAVLEKLKIQREMIRCCDVILHVDGQQFHAHRCVLSACSPFFNSLFKASKTVKEQLTVSADNAEVFHTLLIYMYTGTVVIDKSNVSELLKLANKLLLTKLKEYCAEYLQRYLDTINCLTVLEMANKFGLESLQKIANNIITSNLSLVLSGEEILEISLARLENFLKSSNWKLSNEEILSLVTSWVYNNVDQREIHFRGLLTWVSWEDADSKKVLDFIINHPLFVSSAKCRSFLCDILDEHAPHIRSKLEFVVDSNSKYSEHTSVEEGDKFLNLAITTAIGENLLNEPIIDKYLMETGKELLRSDFQFHDQNQSSDFRDASQCKNPSNVVYSQEYIPRNGGEQILMEQSTLQDDFSSISNHSNNQNFDISLEDLNRYAMDTGQKYKHLIIQRSFEDQIHCKNYTSQHDTENYDSFSYSSDRRVYQEPFEGLDQQLTADEQTQKGSNQKFSYWAHKLDSEFFPSGSNTSDVETSQDVFDNFESGSHEAIPSNHASLKSRGFSTVNLPTSVYKKDKLTALDTSYTTNSEFYPVSSSVRFSDYDNSGNICNSQSVNHSSIPFLADANHGTFCEDDCSILQKNEDCRSLLWRSDMNSSSENKFRNSMQDTIIEEQDTTVKEAVENLKGGVRIEHNEEKQIEKKFSGKKLMRKKSSSDSMEKSKVNSGELDDINSDSVETNLEVHKKKSHVISKKKKVGANACSPPSVLRKCDLCFATFTRSKEYFLHMKVHFPGPPFKCDSCKMEFKRIYNLMDHRLIHLGIKPFSCLECSFSTNKKFNLTEHMKLHNDRSLILKCDECDAKFSRKAHLKVHLVKHSSERPFRCETCGWTGKTSSSLNLHRKIHNGELFSCQYRDCAYRTAKKSHLKEHMQYHTKSRPFSCQVCAMTFISRSHLKRHAVKHEAPNLRQCPHCSFVCSRVDGLKIHIKRKHSAAAPPAPLRQRKWCLKKKDSVHFATITGQTKEFIDDHKELTQFSRNSEDQNLRSNSLYPHSFDPPMADHVTTKNGASMTAENPEESPRISCDPSLSTRDEENILQMVSDITNTRDHSTSFSQGGPYLDPSIGQAFPGLLDVSYGSGRFTPPPADDDELYYTGV